jgi:hypothetical protein
VKRLRFYCEHCGAEVGQNAKVCPICGSFFSSVKCPRCGFAGKAEEFAFGCPSCGCSMAANPSPEPIKPLPVEVRPLPWWAFLAAAFVVLGLFLLLLNVLR